jgi:DNA-directed RNA polymerase subunit N (RpoN/RPB10)
MALEQLPMIECSSCGQCIGHLFEDYYDLSKNLIDELAYREVPSGTYITSMGDDISKFIHTYYTWYNNIEDKSGVLKYSPKNIVARALLRLQDLTEDSLPFGSDREPDMQLSPYNTRICCLRMFMSDPGVALV